MSHEQPIEQDPPPGLAWPVVPMAVPFLYAWVAWSWWVETRTQLEAVPEAAANAGVMALAAVVGRVPAVLSEAAVYHLWWRSRGLRLPYWRFTCWVVALSIMGLSYIQLRVSRAAEPAR